MKHLKSKAVLLLLCYTLLGIAVPAYAQDYKHWVAGTEFEPNKIGRAQYPFYLHEYGKPDTDCKDIEFYHGDIFPQHIIVADNQQYNAARTILYTGRSYDVREFGYNRANSTPGNMYNLDYNEYIVTTPGSLAGKRVGGLAVSQDSRVVNSGMFITKTANPDNIEDKLTECLFHYRVDGLTLTEKSNFQLAIGFVNLSTKKESDGDLSYGLTYDIYGVIKEANGNEKIEYIYAKKDGLWTLNSGESKELTESRSREFGVESTYSSIIVTIYISQAQKNHIVGIDYINIYSEYEISPEAPTTAGYNECATTTETEISYTSLFKAEDIAEGTLKFYEDEAKTTSWPKSSFKTNIPVSETIYYTFTDTDGKESKVSSFRVVVRENPVIAFSSSMLPRIEKCNTKNWTVSAEVSATPASNVTMAWSLDDNTKQVTIGSTSVKNNVATADVSFETFSGGQVYTEIGAVLTATATNTTADGSCTATKTEELTTLVNQNCTELRVEPKGDAPAVCNGNAATFQFTLTNASLLVDVTDVYFNIVLGTGFGTPTVTALDAAGNTITLGKEGNSYILRSLPKSTNADLSTVTIKVTASATTDQSTATLKVTKSSGVAMNISAEQKVKVYSVPEAKFASSTSQLCYGQEQTEANVALSKGTFPYTIQYKVGSGSTITKEANESPYTIKETLTDGATITLISVKDINNCPATLSQTENRVTVDKVPDQFTLDDIAAICENSKVEINIPTIKDNGSSINTTKWQLGTADLAVTNIGNNKCESNQTLTHKYDNGKDITYIVDYTCGRGITGRLTDSKPVTVYAQPGAAEAGTVATNCNNGTFTMAATPVSDADKANGIVGTWSFKNPADAAKVSIRNVNDPKTQVTGVPVGSEVTLVWTLSNGKCNPTKDEVTLTNKDCSDIDLDGAVVDAEGGTKESICEDSEFSYVFTLKHSLDMDVKGISVCFSELPKEFTASKITPSYGSYTKSDNKLTWTIDNLSKNTPITFTITGKVLFDVNAIIKEKSLGVTATVCQIGADAKEEPKATAEVKVYQKPSAATIDMESEVEQCNVGSFTVEANSYDVGTGKWVFVDPAAAAAAGVVINNADQLTATVVGVPTNSSVQVKWSVSNGECATSYSQTVTLTNKDCSDIDLDGAVVDAEGGIIKSICEDSEFSYVFTLKHSLDMDVKGISVCFSELPQEFTASKITPSYGNYTESDNKLTWTIDQLSKNTPITFTITGKVLFDVNAIIKEKSLGVTATVCKIGADVKNEPVATATVKVYQKPSAATIDMESEVEQCNVGTFTVTAQSYDVGTGKWVFVNQTAAEAAGIVLKNADKLIATVENVPTGSSVQVQWSITNGDCTTSYSQKVTLTNKDCSGVILEAKVQADGSNITSICEDSEFSYVFTLSHEMGLDLTNVDVCLSDIPEEFKVSGIRASLGSYDETTQKWHMDKLASDTEVTLTVTGKVLFDATKIITKQDFTLTATVCKIGNDVTTKPVAPATVTIYQKPSKAAINVESKIEQCNNGEFSIKAVNPQVGKGTWSFVGDAPEGVIILNVNNFETKVIGVPVKSKVTVRWSVVNGECTDDNYVDVELINNSCTEFELNAYGTAPTVCYGDEAAFQFTLQNTAEVEVENVELQLVLENGLQYVEATADGIAFANNKCVIPTMGVKQTVVIDVKANATINGAKATVKVIKSSDVKVENVSAQQAVTVNDLPQVSFAATSSTICVDENSKEATNVVVNFTKGTPDFTISYKVGDKVFTDVPVEGNTFPIIEDITGDTNIAITQVVDANQCANTFGNVTHTVNTQKHATLGELAALDEVCEGTQLSLTAPAVTTNGATVSNQKWMLNDEEFATDTKLVFEDHNNASLYYTITSSCNGIEKEIETLPVTVQVINGNVDFDLKVSAEKILAGGEETVVAVVPVETEADTYSWVVNNKPVQENGLEYAAYLYLDTKFEVTGSNRCDSKTKEVFVEVTWPTAFTPYNKNGMNETFAKGLPLAIFNRFGLQIFQGEDGWDGVMNMNIGKNTMAVPGVYYYAVQLPDGNVKKGTIEIVKF